MSQYINALKSADLVEHRKAFGGYNDYPPNWQECDENDFWHAFMNYEPQWIEFRQPEKAAGGLEIGVKLFWFAGRIGGYGLVHQIERAVAVRPKFFKFYLCDHTYDRKVLGNCYYEYTCTKCGSSFREDSSD